LALQEEISKTLIKSVVNSADFNLIISFKQVHKSKQLNMPVMIKLLFVINYLAVKLIGDENSGPLFWAIRLLLLFCKDDFYRKRDSQLSFYNWKSKQSAMQ
jgi:hypothetical protein